MNDKPLRETKQQNLPVPLHLSLNHERKYFFLKRYTDA